MKIYQGRRLEPEKDTGSDVEVTVNGKPLKHRIYHSPTGFNWGYMGSGPADLARSILWDYLGKEPSRPLYMDFKVHFVSGWKDEWKFSSKRIKQWLEERNGWRKEMKLCGLEESQT